jgi:hypothetical protein
MFISRIINTALSQQLFPNNEPIRRNLENWKNRQKKQKQLQQVPSQLKPVNDLTINKLNSDA